MSYIIPKQSEIPSRLSNPKTISTLEARGLSASLAAVHDVRDPGSSYPNADLSFVYRSASGEIVNIKHLITTSQGRTYRTIPGASLPMWGIDRVKTDQQFRLVITEGEFDALAVKQAGIEAVVSVPNGASSKPSNYLSSIEHLIHHENCTGVILAVDNDEPGQLLEESLADAIGRARCDRVVWPGNIKDANEYLQIFGEARLHEIITSAEPFPIAGIIKPISVLNDVMALYRREVSGGYSTGWSLLDELYTVKGGQLTIVTGSPMSGKSEFVDALMVNIARSQDRAFAVYSPEYYPVQRYVQKWIEKYSQTSLHHIEERDIPKYVQWVSDHLSILYPDEPTIPDLLELADVECLRSDIFGMVIDPWSETEHNRPNDVTETAWIGKMLTDIREFARLHGIHIWVVAHPTKQIRNSETGEYGVVSPYDISGSAHWFNKADVILSVWRDRKNEEVPVQVHVQKVRYREVGRLGMAEFTYDRSTGIYRDISVTFPDGTSKQKGYGFGISTTTRG